MANHESSHARNIANLQRATEAARSLGSRYQPTRDLIKVPVLDAFATDCETALTAAGACARAFNDARDARRALFADLGRFATRVQKGLAATEGGARAAEDARALALKIKGERATEPKAAPADATEMTRQTSVAQTSFDNRIANFGKLVALCTDMARSYTPAEEELKPASLSARLAGLAAANLAVNSQAMAYSNALIARDRMLYDPKTGMLARIEAMRTYLDSAFGTGSPERKLLKGLNIRTMLNERLAAV